MVGVSSALCAVGLLIYTGRGESPLCWRANLDPSYAFPWRCFLAPYRALLRADDCRRPTRLGKACQKKYCGDNSGRWRRAGEAGLAGHVG